MDIMFRSIVNQSNNYLSIFNLNLIEGSFKNDLFFGKGNVTGFYAKSYAGAQISLKDGKIKLGVFGKFSIINVTGQIGIESNNYNKSLIGSMDIGTISAMAGIIIDKNEETYFAGIDVKASLFTARGGSQFKIFNTQIEIGGSINAFSAGFKFGIGIENGDIYYTSGISALFGYDFYIRIKFA